ncbi:hypothetical protein ASPCAL10408 [Aspergillus calidoustus]|uniref:Uncharacterized protein n=1 Tax=Aspergillus calidoustus TaxID=454130 RepID=A0A0U5G8J0_ASPCI|nr:hypothetical protein ASPCAL10408 [Aspergillus calidoustus]
MEWTEHLSRRQPNCALFVDNLHVLHVLARRVASERHRYFLNLCFWRIRSNSLGRCTESLTPQIFLQCDQAQLCSYCAYFYFGAAKKTLGNLFEGCVLETAQALLLLSAFCQNALRSHSAACIATRLSGLLSALALRPEFHLYQLLCVGIRTWGREGTPIIKFHFPGGRALL